MKEYIKRETELDLLELLRFYLSHIVSIILAGVIFAAAFAGYKVYNGMRSAGSSGVTTASTEAEQAAEEESEAISELQLAAKEQTELNHENYKMEMIALQEMINNIQSQISRENVYTENSILMNLNPYDVMTSSAMVAVRFEDTEDLMKVNEVLTDYTRKLGNGDYLYDLAAEQGIELTYLRELISIEFEPKATSEDVVQGKAGLQLSDLENSVFLGGGVVGYLYVDVKGASQEQAEKIMDAILARMEELHEENSTGAAHELELVDRSCMSCVDTRVRSSQTDSNYYMVNLVNQLNSLTSCLINLKVPEVVSEEKLLADTTLSGETAVSKKDILKYGLIGAVAGIFLMLLYYGLVFMFDDRLVSYSMISMRFNVNHLGSFAAKDNKARLSESETMEMICANVRLYSGEKDRILLAGGANSALLESLEKTLSERLPGHEFIAGGNIADNPQAREKLSSSDAVLLVEERNVSKYSMMSKELELLKKVPQKLLGVVVA